MECSPKSPIPENQNEGNFTISRTCLVARDYALSLVLCKGSSKISDELWEHIAGNALTLSMLRAGRSSNSSYIWILRQEIGNLGFFVDQEGK